MFKKATLIVVIFTAMILAYAAMQPDTFRIERSISISASPDKIFPHIDDFHQWGKSKGSDPNGTYLSPFF